MTQVIKVDPENLDSPVISQAAGVIRSGGLVAFPTETVYGLGANSLDHAAIKNIFIAKGRPADNPLIVHICDIEMLGSIATEIPATTHQLIEAFWPGPLTFVLKRRHDVPEDVSAGLPTIAVRMPQNSIALALIRAAGAPIAAPSANLSGRPSPTTAGHVLQDLGGKIDIILDGGPTGIGIESTVLDMTTNPPLILRPGWVTDEMISSHIGSVSQGRSEADLIRSPGTRHRHYSPHARVILLETNSSELINRTLTESLQSGPTGFIGYSQTAIIDPELHIIRLSPAAENYAHFIYSAMRELDDRKVSTIVIESIRDEAAGIAVMDRLRRAASEIIF